MATIQSQMVLNDGMSSVLKKITAALDITLNSFEQVQRASGAAVDSALIEQGRSALVSASVAIDQMADGYRQAAQQEKKLNQNINQGASAMDGMLKKVISMVAAYASVSTIKNEVTAAMRAADVQAGAQAQLRTVLGNMGATDVDIGGTELESTLNLDTTGAVDSYNSFMDGVGGSTVTVGLQADNTQVISAYDAIVAKASEIQSRGMYGDEAMIAGAAELATYFTDTEAILGMMDTLTNYAAGMSGGGALDSEAMVEYATGIGKIMSGSYDAMTKKGFEFSDAQKAIIEGTATEQQIIAELGQEYVNMSGDMQAAAVIGAVIDEGWAGLYETMSNTPEGQIIQFNNALGDVQEAIGAGIYPAVLNLMSVFQQNLPQIQDLALGLTAALGFVIGVLTVLANGAISFGSAVMDNWSWISPIVWGIVTALIAYLGYLGAMKIAELVSTATKIAMCVASYAHAAATHVEASATAKATAEQYKLNAALLSSPITWIVVGVIALVAGVMALCSWIAKTTGVAATGFGVIAGGINVAIQAVKNAGLVVANAALGIWKALGAVCSNIGTAFHIAIAQVQGWFYGLLSTALTVVEGICAALNKLPFIEFDYSGITERAEEYKAKAAVKAAEAASYEEDYVDVADAFNAGLHTYETLPDGWASEAFQAGAAWGDSIADKVSGLFSYELGSIDDFMDQMPDVPENTLNDMGSDVADIADSTGSMAESLEISGDELKYLRDIAERDAINRFTTAEVKIDMTGMTNKIDSGLDLDRVLARFTDGFAEALTTAAEGVHA